MFGYDEALARSGGRCEAMVKLPRTWARCGKPVVEVHHAVKRSRGGQLLDPYTGAHLLVLCRAHHRYAETSGDDSGLLIDGYVTTVDGQPRYLGSDAYLTAAYGPPRSNHEARRDREDRQG